MNDTRTDDSMRDPELARLRDRYRALTEQIQGLGFIATGSVSVRYTVCATPGCRCHHDPPQPHGPYLQHTRKVAGTTVTTRLTTEQAERYRDQIANRRRLDELITTMSEISTQARELPPDLQDPPTSQARTETDHTRGVRAPAPHEVATRGARKGDPTDSPRRNDNETTTPCPTCARPFTQIRRQRYCSPACRQAAWRTRHQDPIPTPVIAPHPHTPRRAITVYHCPDCDTRSLGEQWCHDCDRPRTRLDYGGLCPHCDEPITLQDITDQHQARP